MAIQTTVMSRVPTPEGDITLEIDYDDSVVADSNIYGDGYWVTEVRFRNPTQWPVNISVDGLGVRQVEGRFTDDVTLDTSTWGDSGPLLTRRFHTNDLEVSMAPELPKSRPGSVSNPTNEGTNSSTSVAANISIASLNSLPTTGDTLLIASAAIGGEIVTGMAHDFDVTCTWTEVDRSLGDNNSDLTVFEGRYSGDPGTNKTVTFQTPVSGRKAVSLESLSGHNTTTPIVQTTNGESASSSCTIPNSGSLSAISTGSMTMSSIHGRGASAATEDADMTEVAEVTSTGSNEARLGVCRHTTTGQTAVTWTGLGSDNGGVLFEIGQASAAARRVIMVT